MNNRLPETRHCMECKKEIFAYSEAPAICNSCFEKEKKKK